LQSEVLVSVQPITRRRRCDQSKIDPACDFSRCHYCLASWHFLQRLRRSSYM